MTAQWHLSWPAALSALVILAALTPARAQGQLEPITDRDYAIDLYQGWVFGSGRIVGMGGAQVALAQGSSGISA
ncbi:MAG: hypothetical protein AAGC55_22670, partial [Myxococcota bacterium]